MKGRGPRFYYWAATCDFQQCGIFTCVDSDKPLEPPVKLRNSKWCSVSSLTVIEYSSTKQSLWSDCAYAQADQRLCLSHIPHCRKSHVAAHMVPICPLVHEISCIQEVSGQMLMESAPILICPPLLWWWWGGGCLISFNNDFLSSFIFFDLSILVLSNIILHIL